MRKEEEEKKHSWKHSFYELPISLVIVATRHCLSYSVGAGEYVHQTGHWRDDGRLF